MLATVPAAVTATTGREGTINLGKMCEVRTHANATHVVVYLLDQRRDRPPCVNVARRVGNLAGRTSFSFHPPRAYTRAHTPRGWVRVG